MLWEERHSLRRQELQKFAIQVSPIAKIWRISIMYLTNDFYLFFRSLDSAFDGSVQLVATIDRRTLNFTRALKLIIYVSSI